MIEDLFEDFFKEGSTSRVILPVVLFVFFMTYFYLAVFFWQKNYYWILPAFIYIFVFLLTDQLAKRKDLDERLKIKNPKDIRINFWKY